MPELVLDEEASRARFSKFKQKPMSIEEFLATSMSVTHPDSKRAFDAFQRTRKQSGKDLGIVSTISKAVSILGFMKSKRELRTVRRF